MILNADTTWASGQTLTLTEPIQIAPGVKLTIESGVVVQGNGNLITVFGTLEVRGDLPP